MVLRGIQGVGKTEAARRYLMESKAEYICRVWIRSDKKYFDNDIYGFLLKNGLGKTTRDIYQAFAHTLNKRLFNQVRKWLVVFDDVTDPDILKCILEMELKCDVLITTHVKRFNTYVSNNQIIDLREMDMSETLELFCSIAEVEKEKRPDERLAKELWEISGGIPLVIRQIAGYLHSKPIMLGEYMELFHKENINGLMADDPNNYHDCYIKTIKMSYDSIRDKGSEVELCAVEILNFTAFLAPEHIHNDFLFSLFEGVLYDIYRKAFDVISAFQLLETGNGVIKAKKINQKIIRELCGLSNDSARIIKRIFKRLAEDFLKVPMQHYKFDVIANLAAHTQYLTDIQNPIEMLGAHDNAALLYGMGNTDSILGEYGKAAQKLQEALKLIDKGEETRALIDKDKETLRLMIDYSLACVYESWGDDAKALEYVNMFEPSVNMYNCEHNLCINEALQTKAYILDNLERYNDVRDVLNDILAHVGNECIGCGKRNVLYIKSDAYNLMGRIYVYGSEIDLSLAKAYLDKALKEFGLSADTEEDLERLSETRDISAAYICSSYACLFINRKNYPLAEKAYIAAKCITETVYSDTHPDMAFYYGNYANMLMRDESRANHLELADMYYKKAEAIAEHGFQESSDRLLTIWANYGLLLFYREKFDDAIAYFEKVLKQIQDTEYRTRVHMLYMIALAYYGLGEVGTAHKHLIEARDLLNGVPVDEASGYAALRRAVMLKLRMHGSYAIQAKLGFNVGKIISRATYKNSL